MDPPAAGQLTDDATYFERFLENIPEPLKLIIEPAVNVATIAYKGYYDYNQVQHHRLRENFGSVANSALAKGVFISFVGILVEAIRLYQIWGELCETKEFLCTGFNEKKADIRRKLDQIPEKLNQFAEGLQPSSLKKLNFRQKQQFFVRKTREHLYIRRLLDEIEKDIGKLECSVNGRISSLSAFSHYSTSAVVGQGLQAASLGVSTGILGSFANPITFGLAGLAIGSHVIAICTRLSFAKKARSTVKELAEKLDELQLLRNECENQKLALDSLFEQFLKDFEEAEQS